MSGPSRTLRLTAAWIGLGSCLRTGLLGGALTGGVVFLASIVLWLIAASGLQQAIGAAFSSSRAQIDQALGLGTGLTVSLVLAVLAGVAVVLAAVLLPLLYALLARRTRGITVTLVSAE
ncbi:DUF3566 domain-containing protein [Amnibacterium sp. CER49]|uniref:DUF3566 domain-containing protein n=1 Tax=Amnibacterium sp. CER49 TaxID=3039161 RepID=UPI0024482EE9|nr:DUF3566 domain-containing protein [Amnibacterium sp. CER49]MDH2443469.1 DUF3566 domain-containing protein [Amnibacterium sp. CER49]